VVELSLKLAVAVPLKARLTSGVFSRAAPNSAELPPVPAEFIARTT